MILIKVQKKPGRPRRQSAITDNAVTPDEPDACTNTFSTENCDSHQNADSCRAQQAENVSNVFEIFYMNSFLSDLLTGLVCQLMTIDLPRIGI